MTEEKNNQIEKFSFDTIEDFDNHIDLSIQNYSGLIEHIKNISTYFIKEDTIVYDIGCSTGNLMKVLKKHNDIPVKYVGIDKATNLTEGNEDIINMDLNDWKADEFSFGASLFTLQFLPIRLRKQVLKQMHDNLMPGGAIIVSEKIFMENGFVQDLLNFSHYDFKRKSFESHEILNKQVDLRYIMKPLTEQQNINMFKESGFSQVQSFWQSLHFKAWILIKDIV